MKKKQTQKETLGEKVKDFLAGVKKRLEKEIKADEENRREAVECLKFTQSGNQWPAKEREDRTRDGRPCLEVNLINKFPAQVVGDMLHNRARVSVKPVDFKADPHIAKIRGGIIQNIEYVSNGEDIYLEAGKMQVTSGYGTWRVGTRYCEDNPFLQEIYLELLPNPFMVYLDSKRKDPAGADAKYGFILNRIPKDDFKEMWPNAEVPTPSKIPSATGIDRVLYDTDSVTVIDYYVVKPEKETFCLLEDGTVLPEEDANKLIVSWQEMVAEKTKQITEQLPEPPAPGADPAAPGLPQPPATAPQAAPGVSAEIPGLPPEPKIIGRRTTPVRRVRHYTLTLDEILPPKHDGFEELREEDGLDPETLLEGNPIPGCYVPIVQVTGPTLNIEGKTYIKGLIKDAKDAQKLVNYWETALAETIALAPKSPWLATNEQIEGYENDYINANVKNYAVLKYNAVVGDNGQLLPPPMRQSPSAPPTALFTQAQRAHDNLKAVMGMFGGDVGEVGPERSAPAVLAKQKPGDISTYVYGYNLNRGIEHSGKIMNAMIPEIYDSERDVRLRNVDDTEAIVPINTTAGTALKNAKQGRYENMNTTRLVQLVQQHGKGAKFNDITVGKYDIVVKTGPSYATQREEAQHWLQNMMQVNPREMSKYMDILFESMDFAGAEKMASRARRTMPPGLVNLKDGEQPYNPPPAPQMQVVMAKVQNEHIKERVNLAKEQGAIINARLKLVELYRAMAEDKSGIRAEILTILQELHAPTPEQPGQQPQLPEAA